jgi:hypothetical protein
MKTLTSKEEFVNLGKQYSGRKILGALDRLLPRATEDRDRLATAGYTPAMLAALTALRDQIRLRVAGCTDVRGSKQGARAGEGVVLEEARLVVQQGIASASAALERRAPAAGETPEETREKAAELSSQVVALRRAPGTDAAGLRTRLTSLQTLLAAPDFAPAAEELAARGELMQRLEVLIAAITAQAESKKSLKEQSKDDTIRMAEMVGRAYANMRILVKVGRAVFRAEGDRAHARMYALTELHRRAPKAAARDSQAELAPVVPMHSPGPAGPITPAVNE